MTRAGLKFAGVAVAALILAALYWIADGRARFSMPQPGPVLKGGAPQSASEALALYAKNAADWGGIAEARGNDWIAWETVASARLAAARLSGAYADYAAAGAALDAAFAMTPSGVGPNHARAGFEFALHRLEGAEAALAAIARYAVPDPPEQRAEQAAMRGDVAFYRGDNAQALARYREALGLGGGASGWCRIAQLQWRQGEIDSALDALARCDAAPRYRAAQFAASIAMQRGMIELGRGDWDGAARDFAEADRLFPGDWRVALRRQLLRAALGDPAGAARAIEALARDGERPEVADSLANLFRLGGDGVRSRAWAARAGAIWDARVAQFPEASWGHARDHELAFGDPRRALALAGADARNRPYGEALVGLARAWLVNGRADYALALLARARRTGWSSMDLERTAAEAHALAGHPEAAEASREAVLAIDPRAYDPARGYIWLDH